MTDPTTGAAKPPQGTRRLHPPRRFLAPEVIQSSSMDCGPAALKCLLSGFGLDVGYDRLRESCQTDVDGSSIDTLENVANRLGLETAQHMLPKDALLEATQGTGPFLVVVLTPSGAPHFVIRWGVLASRVQLMDPAVGRRWLGAAEFEQKLYEHPHTLSASDWLEFSRTGPFLPWLVRRLDRLGLGSRADAFVDQTIAASGWRGLAATDAAARTVEKIVRAGGIPRGHKAVQLFERCLDLALIDLDRGIRHLPPSNWFVTLSRKGASGEEMVTMRGVVTMIPSGKVTDQRARLAGTGAKKGGSSRELSAALAEKPMNPLRELLGFLRKEDTLSALSLVVGLLLSAGGAIAELMIFRASLTLIDRLGLIEQRLAAGLAFAIFLGLLVVIEGLVSVSGRHLGRMLEGRLRMAILFKVPRLIDSYFRSRLVSDMAQRVHTVHTVRETPALAQAFVRASLDLLVTVGAICFLQPRMALLTILGALASIVVPSLLRELMAERDLRVQTHSGAIASFYLDALAGLVPLRAHGAERVIAREHEGLLVEWLRAAIERQRLLVTNSALQSLLGVGVSVAIVFWYMARVAEPQGLLLLLFWAQRIPSLGQSIVATMGAYLPVRNSLSRILEPLRGAERAVVEAPPTPLEAGELPTGVDIQTRKLRVIAGGHTILNELTVHIRAGEHIAIVGRSGAGKSSLVGLLLGWHRPTSGELKVDGEPLDELQLEKLRRVTAWVDPTIQLWNAPLLENIQFGAATHAQRPMAQVVTQSDLLDVLDRLPDGFQTKLGDGGGLVSGGEGQRVRLARALLRRDTRLVILDEPFRGLDRYKRRVLMERARALWATATVLCITHDVSETSDFDRVLVVSDGHVIEDDQPAALLARRTTYRALLEADIRATTGVWASDRWRRISVRGGRVVEAGEDPPRS